MAVVHVCAYVYVTHICADVVSLTRVSAGHINIAVPLKMSRYLVKEKNYVPWAVAMLNFEAIRAKLVEKPSYEFYEVSLFS